MTDNCLELVFVVEIRFQLAVSGRKEAAVGSGSDRHCEPVVPFQLFGEVAAPGLFDEPRVDVVRDIPDRIRAILSVVAGPEEL